MNVEAVRERLRAVSDPDLGDDIVSLGLVNAVDVDDDTKSVRISLALGAPFSPAETQIANDVREALSDTEYDVDLTASVPSEVDPDEDVLPDVTNVIAVASGKGGVGKSTVAVNLAAGLSKLGARVGLFDADVYGPNVPRMVAADEAPQAADDQTIVPPEKYGMKLMSMAFLVGEDDPVIWRGPMVHQLLTQLVEDVQWGDGSGGTGPENVTELDASGEDVTAISRLQVLQHTLAKTKSDSTGSTSLHYGEWTNGDVPHISSFDSGAFGEPMPVAVRDTDLSAPDPESGDQTSLEGTIQLAHVALWGSGDAPDWADEAVGAALDAANFIPDQ